MTKISFLFTLILMMILTSCSVFSPIKTASHTNYVLNALPAPTVKTPSRRISLLIAPIETNAMYNTTQMAYSTQPYQINYFVKNRWAVTPDQMLQALVVQTLQNTHYFQSVMYFPPIGYYDYVLHIQILELRQEFLPTSSKMHVVLRVELVNAVTKKILATQQFSRVEPAQPTPAGGVIAANEAMRYILKKLAIFCLHYT